MRDAESVANKKVFLRQAILFFSAPSLPLLFAFTTKIKNSGKSVSGSGPQYIKTF